MNGPKRRRHRRRGAVAAVTPLAVTVLCMVAAFCIDIGKDSAGAVSGTMNMAGNLGAFVTIIAFPYLYEWTGSFTPFFYVCVGLSAAAMLIWMRMDPGKSIKLKI